MTTDSKNPYGSAMQSTTPIPPPPPQSSNGAKIALIIVAGVFGVLIFFVVVCGAFVFYFVSSVKQVAQQANAQIQEEFQWQQEQAAELVKIYRDYPQLQEKLGAIQSFEAEYDNVSSIDIDYAALATQTVNVVGEKATGVLQVEFTKSPPAQKSEGEFDETNLSSSRIVVLYVNGERTILDANAEQKLLDAGF